LEQKCLRALKAFHIQLGERAFLIGRKAKQCHLFSLCHQQRTQQLTFSSRRVQTKGSLALAGARTRRQLFDLVAPLFAC
jgi:hypothetical protein